MPEEMLIRMGKVNRPTTFKQLMWLLQTIYEASPNGMTRNQISEKWSNETALSQGLPYPAKTFSNHLKDINHIFNITIKLEGHKYAIPCKDDIDLAAIAVWMDYVKITDMIASNPNLRDRILMGSEWSGNKNLIPILTAIRDSVEIRIKYLVRRGILRDYSVRPYYLKLFEGRWYLIGFCNEIAIIYAFLLGDIEVEKITDIHFDVGRIPDKEMYQDNIEFSRLLSSLPKNWQKMG